MKSIWTFAGGAIISLALSACGGGGGGGSGGSPVGATTPALTTANAAPGSDGSASAGGGQNGTGSGTGGGGTGNGGIEARTVFAVAPAVGVIAAFSDPNPAPGSTIIGRTITGLGMLGKSISYDAANDRLYATNGNSIVVFDQVSKASGAVTPTRTISVPAAAFMGPSTSLYFDKASDVLYLCGSQQYNDALAVIPQASTVNGAVTTARVFRLNSGSEACVVDTQRKILYTLGSTIGVFVFDITALSDTLPSFQDNQAVRVMTVPGTMLGTGVAIDVARDRLYVSDRMGKLVIVNGASTATGFAIPNVQVQLPSGSMSVTLDAAHDRLYIGSYPNSAFIINNASSLVAGAAAPAATAFTASSTATTVAGFAFP